MFAFARSLLLGLALLGLVAGCGHDHKHDPKKEKDSHSDHSHGKGPHGGAIADFGKYHIEFDVDHKKEEAVVYVLKADMKTAAPIAAEKLTVKIKDPAIEIELKPAPQKGDPEGKASRFTGKHPKLAKEQEFEGEVTGLVDGKLHRGEFKEEPDEKK
jgi:hypothetical protein